MILIKVRCQRFKRRSNWKLTVSWFHNQCCQGRGTLLHIFRITLRTTILPPIFPLPSAFSLGRRSIHDEYCPKCTVVSDACRRRSKCTVMSDAQRSFDNQPLKQHAQSSANDGLKPAQTTPYEPSNVVHPTPTGCNLWSTASIAFRLVIFLFTLSK